MRDCCMPKNLQESSGKLQNMLLTACRPFLPFVIECSILYTDYLLYINDSMSIFGIVLIIWKREHMTVFHGKCISGFYLKNQIVLLLTKSDPSTSFDCF